MISRICLFSKDPETKRLTVQAMFPEEYVKARFEFTSDRNFKISKLTDVSPFNPDQTPGEQRYAKDINIWFPVVDVLPEPAMYAKAVITGADTCRMNSYFNFEDSRIEEHEVVFQAGMLSHWENGLHLPSKTAEVQSFSMVKEFYAAPSISRAAYCDIQPLSDEWGGTVRAWYQDKNGRWLFHDTLEIVREREDDYEDLGVEDEETALNLCLDYLIRSVNQAAANPYHGGLFLFYDCDADTYRNGQWPWSWGTAIKLLLECAKLAEEPDTAHLIHRTAEELRGTAYRIGLTTLKFQIHNEGHIADHFGTTRYTPRDFSDIGYEELVNTGSDMGFLCGWGWIPLYEATKDERFLQAAKAYIEAMGPILNRFLVPPQEWLPGPSCWTDFTIDESGFGTEGIEALYRVTKDRKYKKLCAKYMDQHLALFEREDGLWDRHYGFSTNIVSPTIYMTRGLGWAMEGLLAAHRCCPDKGIYLDKAVKMADGLIRFQHADGSWGFQFHKAWHCYDMADKGTALWSLLLFMLYEETGEERHLKAARAALHWCMGHQYKGKNLHAKGGIISISGESGVTYRSYFRLCCQYTTSFMGLALLKNRKIREGGNEHRQ